MEQRQRPWSLCRLHRRRRSELRRQLQIRARRLLRPLRGTRSCRPKAEMGLSNARVNNRRAGQLNLAYIKESCLKVTLWYSLLLCSLEQNRPMSTPKDEDKANQL